MEGPPVVRKSGGLERRPCLSAERRQVNLVPAHSAVIGCVQRRVPRAIVTGQPDVEGVSGADQPRVRRRALTTPCRSPVLSYEEAARPPQDASGAEAESHPTTGRAREERTDQVAEPAAAGVVLGISQTDPVSATITGAKQFVFQAIARCAVGPVSGHQPSFLACSSVQTDGSTTRDMELADPGRPTIVRGANFHGTRRIV